MAIGLAVAAHAVLADGVADGRGTLWHDEAISVLAAAGSQDDYDAIRHEGAAPAGRWTTASTWQDLQRIDRIDPVTTARGLGEHDIHPPLYFWALQMGSVVTDGAVGAALVVNVTAAALAASIIAWLVTWSTRRQTLGAAGAAAYLFSPAVVAASGEVRQYGLAAMFAASIVAVTARLVAEGGQPSRQTSVALAVTVAGGLLTVHVMAVWLAVAAVVVAASVVRGTDRLRAAARIGAGVGIGLVVWAAAFPWTLDQRARLARRVPGLRPAEVPELADRWASGVADVVTMRGGDAIAARWLAAAAITLVALAVLRHLGRHHLGRLDADPVLTASVALAVGVGALMTVLYATGQAPEHANGSRYVAPLAAPIAVGATCWLGRRRGGEVGALALVAVIAAGTLGWVSDWTAARTTQRALSVEVSAAGSLVIDCPRGGYVPTVIHRAAPDASVYVADRAAITEAVDSSWASGLRSPSLLLAGGCGPVDAAEGAGTTLDDVLAGVGVQVGGSLGRIERFEVHPLSILDETR